MPRMNGTRVTPAASFKRELLPVVYADVPLHLHPMAMRSLTAHLLKLRADGAATDAAGLWALAGD